MKKILLLVLSYNNEKYILSTLNSIILNNTEHFDVFINDDASSDNSVRIIKNFLVENNSITSNWVLNVNKKNLGINSSIKNILQNSEADWVKVIAGDDEFESEALQQYYKLGIVNDFSNTVVIAGMKYINNLSEVIGSRPPPNKFIYLIPWIRQVNFYVNTIPAPSVMIGRQVFLSALGTTKARNAEDWPILRFVILNNLYFAIENRKLIRYRIHSKSISRYFFRNKFDAENPILGDVKLLLEENLAASSNFFTKYGIKVQKHQLNINSQFFRVIIKFLKLLNPQYLLFSLLRVILK